MFVLLALQWSQVTDICEVGSDSVNFSAVWHALCIALLNISLQWTAESICHYAYNKEVLMARATDAVINYLERPRCYSDDDAMTPAVAMKKVSVAWRYHEN